MQWCPENNVNFICVTVYTYNKSDLKKKKSSMWSVYILFQNQGL